MERKSLIRITLIGALAVILSALLGARLFFIQIIEGDYYRERADRQYDRPAENLPERGSIYFQTKDGQLVSAAAMQTGFILAINPRQISDAASTYRALNEVISLDATDFFAKAGRRDDPYEELLPRIDETTANKITELKLTGVELLKTRWRVYPAGRLAAHAIGFLGYEGSGLTGKYGLERQYNSLLLRQSDHSFSHFLANAFAEIRETVGGQTPSDASADLILTVEPAVEQVLTDELGAVREQYQADAVGGIVMDPQTGAIVALSAWPDFNPGEKQSSIEPLANPLVENVYEMGSIIKPLTMAAALDAGAVTPTTTYNDQGKVTLGDRTISNFDGRGRGVVSMQEVLNQSLNTGVVFAMQQMGRNKFVDYFTRYGLGQKTGIDLPNEGAGLIQNLTGGHEVEAATAAFGQGIALTPIETIRALATLGNGGRLVTPHVVSALKYQNGKRVPIESPAAPPPVIATSSSATITGMLTRVVDEALVGGAAKITDYSIAAKTGTAQIADPNGGYYADRYLHSFFGYFPASAPRFIVFLYLIHPRGVEYASATLTHPFMNLTKFLLNYYNLPPDRAL